MFPTISAGSNPHRKGELDDELEGYMISIGYLLAKCPRVEPTFFQFHSPLFAKRFLIDALLIVDR